MKRRYTVITMLFCIVFFTGCQKAVDGGLANDNEEIQPFSQESSIASHETLPEDAQSPFPQADGQSKSVMQAFRSVLLNEAVFSCTDKVPGSDTIPIYQFNGFLNEIPYDNKNPAQVCRFAIVDMDGDSIPEVVLEIGYYSGCLILRYVDGRIQGNFLDYRAMYPLKENGSFESENSAFEGFIQKLYFIGDTVYRKPDRIFHSLFHFLFILTPPARFSGQGIVFY